MIWEGVLAGCSTGVRLASLVLCGKVVARKSRNALCEMLLGRKIEKCTIFWLRDRVSAQWLISDLGKCSMLHALLTVVRETRRENRAFRGKTCQANCERVHFGDKLPDFACGICFIGAMSIALVWHWLQELRVPSADRQTAHRARERMGRSLARRSFLSGGSSSARARGAGGAQGGGWQWARRAASAVASA